LEVAYAVRLASVAKEPAVEHSNKLGIVSFSLIALAAFATGACSGAKGNEELDDNLLVAESSNSALEAPNGAPSGSNGPCAQGYGDDDDDGHGHGHGKGGKGENGGDDDDDDGHGHGHGHGHGKQDRGVDDGHFGPPPGPPGPPPGPSPGGACPGDDDHDDGSMCHDGDGHHRGHHDHRHHLFKVLDSLDGKRDGVVTLAALPADLPDALVTALHALDTNGDGLVTRDEVKAARPNPPPPSPPVIP
jgi:hypothetical protein